MEVGDIVQGKETGKASHILKGEIVKVYKTSGYSVLIDESMAAGRVNTKQTVLEEDLELLNQNVSVTYEGTSEDVKFLLGMTSKRG